MFERKHWLTKGQVPGFFWRLVASRRSKAHRKALNEDVQAEEEEQERRAVLEEVATHLGPKHPICYDSYCLCDLSHEKKLETFSVAMLQDMLKYFEIPFSSRDGNTNRYYSKQQGFSTSNSKKSWKQLFFKNLKRRFMTFILFEKSN